MKSLQTLLNGLIDYAGLFPPARHDMSGAVKNYASYLSSGNAPMLGRFIVPMSRLSEFEVAHEALPESGRTMQWRLSVLGGNDIESEKEQIAQFNQRHSGSMVIDTVELKASTPSAIELAVRTHDEGVSLYFEIPINDDTAVMLSAIKKSGARAKVRTGGVTGDAFPPSADLARFIHLCAKEHVMFKATAGLHHPIRATYRLTYEKESPTGIMYGFINVFLAAAFAHNGMGVSDIERLLLEEDAKAFIFADESVSWRGNVLSAYQLNSARTRFALSFGSCSFTEPIDDLHRLRLL